MLDIRLIRSEAERVNSLLKRRSPLLSIDALLEIDAKRVGLLKEEEDIRAERNVLNKQVGQLKAKGENADDLMAKTKAMGERVKAIEAEKDVLEEQQKAIITQLPNLPFEDVPEGADENANVVVKTWGDEFKARAAKEALPHWDVAAQLGLLEFERAVKVAQSRFVCLKGDAAKLERSLIDLMLGLHTTKGYEEVMPPFLVNANAMFGTGQLPKFEEDLFKCSDDLFLIPTAEVPVTNLYADEILDETQLPILHAAYTPCFRREAGSAGRDTRGLMRLHQFNKVELVKFVKPETSHDEHMKLLADAEAVLQALELPYRVVQLCTGDMGFSAARCFDIEVWLPSQQCYREISSCSNFSDFQARRANIKYRDMADGGKVKFVHTLNGSGLAVGRTVAAILENYQLPDGQVSIPTALQPYFAGKTSFGTVQFDAAATV